MKKLLIVFITLLLVACAPDEDTAEDIQYWYDACELIPSCAAKIDEMREEQLTESEIIQGVQTIIADHEARIAQAEQDLLDQQAELEAQAERIRLLEERVTMLENFSDGAHISDFATTSLLHEHELLYIMQVEKNNTEEVKVNFNLEYAIQQGFILTEIKTALETTLYQDMQNLPEPENILLVFMWEDNYHEIYLTDLFPTQ